MTTAEVQFGDRVKLEPEKPQHGVAIVTAIGSGYLRTAMRNVSRLLVHWRQAGITPLPDLTLERSAAPKLAYALPILCGTLVTLWQH